MNHSDFKALTKYDGLNICLSWTIELCMLFSQLSAEKKDIILASMTNKCWALLILSQL